MAETNIMNYFNKICRACLKTNESFKYFLFDNISPSLYSFCTSIEVYQDDNLPKTICNGCHDLLTKVFNFKQTCLKSHNTLSECKKTVKVENNGYNNSDSGSHSGASEDNYNNSLECNNIKKEVDYNNVDLTNIGADSVVIKDESSYVNTKSKKNSKRLKNVSLSKQLVVKSVSKINLSSLKRPQILSCKLCKKIFTYPERFEAHKLEHEGKKVTISCTVCNKTFMTWSGLRRHKESEHTRVSLDTLKCRVCGKTSKNKHTLRMHQKTHGERKLCICDVCGKKFVSRTVLKAHLETHEENRQRIHECQQCGKKFFSNTVLLSHISKRHSGKKFICQICTYPFSEKSNLIRHMRLHEGKKMFKCDLCDKSYAASSSLVEHKRVHSGERPFTCVYCPKSFSAKKRLDDHHRIHTGEKPHKCGICNQGFTQRGTLKRHMKIHDKFPSTHN